jgi:SAP domain
LSDKYVPAHDVSNLFDQSAIDLIQDKLAERKECKLVGDYAAADDIRDFLQNEYGVSIDDRVQEWFVKSKRSRADFADYVSLADDKENEADAELEIESTNDDSDQGEEDLNALTVPELKERLKEAGLKVTGKKAELIERLTLEEN